MGSNSFFSILPPMPHPRYLPHPALHFSVKDCYFICPELTSLLQKSAAGFAPVWCCSLPFCWLRTFSCAVPGKERLWSCSSYRSELSAMGLGFLPLACSAYTSAHT